MHILLIPSWYPTSDNPIKGIFFQEQALALQESGHQVGILVPPTFQPLRRIKFIHRLRDLGAKIYMHEYAGLKTYRASLWGWTSYRRFKRLHRAQILDLGKKLFTRYYKENGFPDILHAHSILYGGYIGADIKQKWHLPLVVTEHSSRFLLQKDIISANIDIIRDSIASFDRLLVVGPQLREVLQEFTTDHPVEILGNMVDSEYFTIFPQSIPLSPFIFTSIAFLTANKGFFVLLKAFQYAFQGKDVLLKIGGDGVLLPSLKQEARILGIEQQVEFRGSLTREEVRNLLQHSHVLVSSSYVETFGVTLIEAMACGKPVVATKSGGPELFVNERNGILVPPGNADALARAMISIKKDYHLYDPHKIRSECLSRFSKRAIIKRLEEIYRQVSK